MKKGKQGQARKKAPPPEDKVKVEEDVQDDEMQLQFYGQARKKAPPPEDKVEVEENVQDDEMQLQFYAKNDKTSTVNSSSTITPLVPSTAKVTKECDGSISTSLTKTSNS